MKIHNYTDADGNAQQCIEGDDGTHKIVNGKVVAKTQTELNAEAAVVHNAPIKAKLAELDIKRIRPFIEGNATHLDPINAEIAALRATLK